jgi:hypothetical protein
MDLDGTDPKLLAKIYKRRLSVNDLIRDDVKRLLARTDLSKEDRNRLDLHFSSIRKIEMDSMDVMGPELDKDGIQAIDGKHEVFANQEAVVRFHFDIIAFAFASDRVRTATVQVGAALDHTRYTVNGVETPPYHYVSHRQQGDAGSGDAIPDAQLLHHEIDRIHARMFKHLLDRLSAYTLPTGGTLLDSSVNLWTNSLANGPPHSGKGVPSIIAGGAGGFLKTGLDIEVEGYNSKSLSTIASACGVTKDDGSLVDNFGDPENPGLLDEIIA